MVRFRKIAIALWLVSTLFAAAGPASAQAPSASRVARIVEAYGGSAALDRVRQVEFEWAGYYGARYQSRHTEPPFDRLPVRNWSAIDFTASRSVSDSISTYPGELNLALRVINDGTSGWSVNTIARLYSEGAMFSHQGIVEAARNRMPWMLAREMAANPAEFEDAGTRALRGITYDLLRRGETTMWVHPQTSLIHALSWKEDNMVDVETDVMRTYTDYFEHEGVMINRRQQAWAGDDVTADYELYSIRFNRPVDRYLKVPDGFLRVPTFEGYNGNTEIGVERIGAGIFLAGDGETRVLYVEFDDHFVAMEAGGMPDYAERTYNAMRPHMRDKPLRYIIPTHHHDDHAVAIHFYARIGATILTTRNKEGFLRRLLTRSWGDAPAVKDAKFRFIDESRLVLEDESNRLDVHVYADAPHSEKLLIGYLPREATLYSCDIFIGWVGDIRQGASYGVRHLAQWVAGQQASGQVGAIRNYPTCHGRAYSAAEFAKLLDTPRTIVALPNNERWPTSSWPNRFGLIDDTAQNARRDRVVDSARPQ